jgi:hypothetical protein
MEGLGLGIRAPSTTEDANSKKSYTKTYQPVQQGNIREGDELEAHRPRVPLGDLLWVRKDRGYVQPSMKRNRSAPENQNRHVRRPTTRNEWSHSLCLGGHGRKLRVRRTQQPCEAPRFARRFEVNVMCSVRRISGA